MTEASIFAAAQNIVDLQERRAYLDQACGLNTALRAELESLLQADRDAGAYFEHAPEGLATLAADPYQQETLKSGPTSSVLPFLSPCATAGRIGKLVGSVGEYEIIDVVGQGGMGTVLRAYDTKLSRIVAIKVMAPEMAANPMAVKRFLREAQSAAAVHHDHVVTIHAIDDTNRPPFLVMQFVAGQTLQQKLDREGALELQHILSLGSQIASGLSAAHEQGLIHRDVKPGNILLENGEQRVKVTDFGLARAADDLEMTRTGMIAGTPQYMSPEQAKGEFLDARSDIFSLGSVLYAMCTGRPAFRAESALAVMHQVCESAPTPIRELNADIPAWMEAVVQKLMAKDKHQRFQTMAEVTELLGQHAARLQRPMAATEVLPPAPVGRSNRRRVVVATFVGLLMAGLMLAEVSGTTRVLATIIRITRGEATIVVQVDDPAVKVTVDGEELVISNAGPQEIRVRPGQHTVAATKAGQPVVVDQPLVSIRRGDREVVRVTLLPNETAAAANSAVRNPFGLADVLDPAGEDVQAFAENLQIEGAEQDANAPLWTDVTSTIQAGSIDGQWAGRWHGGDAQWVTSTAQIRTVGPWVYILFGEPDYLIAARRTGDRLVGRYQNVHAADDATPWVGRILGPDRIDGYWNNGSLPPQARWDFRRKAEVASINFNGTWQSEWGEVKFQHSLTNSTQPFQVQGTYYDGAGKIKGTVDPKTRTMIGTFEETAHERGKVRLVLSADNSQIQGHFGYKNADRDDPIDAFPWDMTRTDAASTLSK